MKLKHYSMKLISTIFTLFLMLCAFNISTLAEIKSGAAGPNATWELDTSTGELHIYGTGATYDRHGNWNYYDEYTKYDASGNGVDNYGVSGTQYSGSSPINAYRTQIKSVVIDEGITSIGAAFFYQCTNLTSVTMASTVSLINYEAFRGCSNLESITIGSGVTEIKGRSFTDCSKLSYIYVADGSTSFVSVGGVLYTADLKRLVRFPEALNVIDYVIPEGCEIVDTDALYKLRYVQSLTIPTTLTTISYGSLDSCSNLTSLVLKSVTPPALEKTITGTTIKSVFVPCGQEAVYTNNGGNWSSLSGKVTGAVVVDFVVNSNDSKLGDVEISQRADCESFQMEITAIPTVYGTFVQWQDGNTDNPRIVTVEATSAVTYEYTAYFDPKPYNITVEKGSTKIGKKIVTSYYQVSVTDNGTPEVKGQTSGTATSVTKSYYYGDEVTIYCDVTTAGYKFSKWSDGNKENPRVVTVSGEVTYTATIEAGQVTIKTVSNSDTYGTTSPSSETVSFGDELTISATPKTGYQFLKWDDGNAEASRTITATADKTYTAYFGIKTYTITATANNADWGNITGYGTFQAGKSTTLVATPNEGYYFVKWSDGNTNASRTITNIASDQEYIAEFKAYQFDVIFKNATGGTLSSSKVDYGTMPTALASPAKASTAEYDYTFIGWSPELSIVTGAQTYTPMYSSVKRKYTITFVDGNGKTLQTSEVEYGVVPTYTGVKPTKTATAQYSYTFKGWDKSLVAVTGNATYTAQYTSTVNEYDIVFVDDDETILLTTRLAYGATVTLPEEPTKESTAQYSYTFSGWTPTVTKVTGDKTYKATYSATANEYTITFVDGDGNEIQKSKVAYGVKPSCSVTATKTSTDEYSYTFKSWSPSIVKVTEDATYTAEFTSKKRSYPIIFKNYDGTILETVSVEYGKTPSYSKATPTKESTASETYTFVGWSPNISVVSGEAVYIAQFSQSAVLYTVKFLDYDGSQLDSRKYEYGATPSYSETPKRAADAQYIYTFVGWTPEVTSVTQNVSYTAVYEKSLRTYTIKFVNGTETLQTSSVSYNTMPVYEKSTPTKASTAEYSYTFNGWSPELAKVTKSQTYTAQFTQTKNKYTITFKDDEGNVLSSEEYDYGTTPTEPTPTKAPTAQYTYTFAGWNNTVKKVTADAEYVAIFNSSVNKYVIKFVNEDGTELDSEEYSYDDTPVYAGTPTKASDAEYSYIFSGWDKPIANVTSDATYTATYSSTKNSYYIHFVDADGNNIKTLLCEYGQVPVYDGAEPIKSKTAQYTYTFAGWSPELSAVVEETTYQATFAKTTNKYNVSFINYDGDLIYEHSYDYGSVPTCTKVPTKVGDAQYSYTFNGWSPEVVAVESDAVYTAQYVQTVNSYKVTFRNYDGSELFTDNFQYGDIPTYNGETPQRASEGSVEYTFKSWTPEIVAVTSDAEYVAQFSTSSIVYEVSFYDYDGSLLKVVGFDKDEELVVDFEPIRKNTESHIYTFAGWTPELVVGSAVTSNMSFTANYSEEIRKYTVNFVNADGSIVQTEDVAYDTMPLEPIAKPAKASDEQYDYNFIGWDQVLTPVHSDQTYTAQYASSLRQYTIKFVNYDGSILQESVMNYGSTPSYAEKPQRDADKYYSYEFSGWDKQVVDVVADATYTATYNAIGEKYLITVYSNNDEYGVVSGGGLYMYGDEVTLTANPNIGYEFKQWSDGNTSEIRSITVSENAEYTAEFVSQTTTAISDESVETTSISVQNRTIIVETSDANIVTIYTLSGQLLYVGNGHIEYDAPMAGMYIVKTLDLSRKVLLK